ncbi:MAG: hypothetical protein ABH804_00470 [archaeon]
MRKIISKKASDRKKRKNQIIVGIVLVFLMLVSVVGYSFQGTEGDQENQKIDYNGFEFVKINDLWFLSTGNYEFSFKYNPLQTENINSELKKISNYQGNPLYYSSENNEALSEIYINLNMIVQRFQPACLEGEECDENIPVKNCGDNFILIKEKNNSRIYQDENCVFIEGQKGDLTKLSDEFLFKIIGVK